MANDTWADFNPEPAGAATPKELTIAPGKPAGAAPDAWADFNPSTNFEDLNTKQGSFNERLQNGAALGALAGDNQSRFSKTFHGVWDAVKEGAAAGYDSEGLEAGWKQMDKELRDSGHEDNPLFQDLKHAIVLGQAGMHAVNGAMMGAGAGVGQVVANVTGANESEAARARRDFAQFTAIGGTFAGTDAALTMPHDVPLLPARGGQVARVEAEDGQVGAKLVGSIPKPEDFKTAADQISTNPATEKKLFDLYNEKGVLPAEAVEAAKRDAFVAHDLGASATVPDSLPPPVDRAVQPAPAPGLISATIRSNVAKMFDFAGDIGSAVNPMGNGTDGAKAIGKDFANLMRRNSWEAISDLNEIDKRFSRAQQTRMWEALNEEQDMLLAREKDSDGNYSPVENKDGDYGLASLAPEEREFVERVMDQNAADWAHAKDVGLVDKDGIPAYAARIRVGGKEIAGTPGAQLDPIGLNLRARTARLKGRSYDNVEDAEAALKARFGEDASFARNIKANIIASKQLRDAIAGKSLVEAIKDYGEKLGTDTVAPGFKPNDNYFTIEHPALKSWQPIFKDGKIVLDDAGEPVMQQVPTFIHNDFEGPLRAVLTGKPSKVATAITELKSKATAAVLISPMVHNSVIFSKAMAGLKGNPFKTFQMYFDGNSVRNNPAIMSEAIGQHGLVPIGKWFFKQDLTDELTMPDLAPGRSWTAKIAGAVPGLFDEGAGDAVKAGVDKMGDFWHNTLLWDRVADLQAGVYAHFMKEFTASGMDRTTAGRAAANEANRLAGTLPREAMSQGARNVANVLLFSRTFTLGNLGIMKDAVLGMPSEVIAQIGRDAGPEAAKTATAIARRTAISTIAVDMALFYAGTSVLQSSMNVMLGGSNLTDEAVGYWTRLKHQMEVAASNPWQAPTPWGIFNFLQGVSAQGSNEPGKEDRVLVGYDERGTGIYVKPSIGRIGEEMTSYSQGFWSDMLKRKLSTIAKPTWDFLANDKGFGRKVYEPDIKTGADAITAAAAIATHFAAAQVPADLATSAWHLLSGNGQKIDALKLVGSFLPVPGATFTASVGYPGGPEGAVASKAVEEQKFRIQQAMPGIRQMIQRGDLDSARETMDALKMDQRYQRATINSTLHPGLKTKSYQMRDFRNYGTEDQKQQFQDLRDQRLRQQGE